MSFPTSLFFRYHLPLRTLLIVTFSTVWVTLYKYRVRWTPIIISVPDLPFEGKPLKFGKFQKYFVRFSVGIFTFLSSRVGSEPLSGSGTF
jgi:hypothetical protein